LKKAAAAAAAAITAEAETERERWTGLMLWIHGPGGVGDEVPYGD
jgi:hypothetical protein